MKLFYIISAARPSEGGEILVDFFYGNPVEIFFAQIEYRFCTNVEGEKYLCNNTIKKSIVHHNRYKTRIVKHAGTSNYLY